MIPESSIAEIAGVDRSVLQQLKSGSLVDPDVIDSIIYVLQGYVGGADDSRIKELKRISQRLRGSKSSQ